MSRAPRGRKGAERPPDHPTRGSQRRTRKTTPALEAERPSRWRRPPSNPRIPVFRTHTASVWPVFVGTDLPPCRPTSQGIRAHGAAVPLGARPPPELDARRRPHRRTPSHPLLRGAYAPQAAAGVVSRVSLAVYARLICRCVGQCHWDLRICGGCFYKFMVCSEASSLELVSDSPVALLNPTCTMDKSPRV